MIKVCAFVLSPWLFVPELLSPITALSLCPVFSLLSACAVSLFSVISLFSAYSVLSLYFVFSAYSVISPSSVVSLFSAYSVNSPCSLSLAVLSVILLTFVSNLSNFLILLLLYNFDLTFFS